MTEKRLKLVPSGPLQVHTLTNSGRPLPINLPKTDITRGTLRINKTQVVHTVLCTIINCHQCLSPVSVVPPLLKNSRFRFRRTCDRIRRYVPTILPLITNG